MNVKVPSSDAVAIRNAFDEHCDLSCKGCIYKDCDCINFCTIHYTHDILTGKMKLTDSFRKDEPKPESQAWCRVGAWVTEGDPSETLGTIDEVFCDGRVGVKWLRNADGCTGSNSLTKYLKPVHFRPYTFEEAKKLVGKILEYTNTDNNDRHCHLITSVIGWTHDDGSTGVIFSHEPWYMLQKYNATIDDMPVGVPEVDEELLKGGQE